MMQLDRILLTRLCVGLLLCGLLSLRFATCIRTSAEGPLLSLDTSRNTKEANDDKIDYLPGWGKVDFPLFGGYVTVDEEKERALYYTFVQSFEHPAKKPLVLWLNGGPGCSSLAGGFLSELGPFYATSEGNLEANNDSWVRAANIIFLESPAFVGWSYSNTSSDRSVGDVRTAQDARKFMLGFLNRFPQYEGHPFWIAGESYGGHYVPNLAEAILTAGDKPRLNLQGFLIGNPWTDAVFDSLGAVDFWWGHAMISDDTRNGMKVSCDFSQGAPTAGSEDWECNKYVQQAYEDMGAVNIYDIYVDVCLASRATSSGRQLGRLAGNRPAGLAARKAIRGVYDPCIDGEVEVFFNRRDVQDAMHANLTGSMPWHWQECSDQVEYSQDDFLASMLPKYPALVGAGLQILIYSGDVDGIVPVVGTRRWVASLGLPLQRVWRPWLLDGQVGGHVLQYEGLTLATVRNAGHMVPYTQPARGFHLFSRWLAGTLL